MVRSNLKSNQIPIFKGEVLIFHIQIPCFSAVRPNFLHFSWSDQGNFTIFPWQNPQNLGEQFPLEPGRTALRRGLQRDAVDPAEALGLRSSAGRAGREHRAGPGAPLRDRRGWLAISGSDLLELPFVEAIWGYLFGGYILMYRK
jgi:hypothetical protein